MTDTTTALKVTCLKCGEEGTSLLNLSDGDTITCSECDAEFTVVDIKDIVGTWAKLLPWIESHPARQS